MTTIFIPREKLHQQILELQHRAYSGGFQQGQHNGHEEGCRWGAAAILLITLEQHFGPLDTELRAWVVALPFADLKTLAQALPQISSLPALETWLEDRKPQTPCSIKSD